METIMKLTHGVLVLSLLTAAPAAAKPKHWHEDGKHANAGSCYFQPQEVRIIREYYEPQSRSLPPGIAKKYYRTGQLPPGWARKMQPLPVAVERQLVVLPRGYRRGYIDGVVVVYSPSTHVVVDVVGLFRP
jgi:hypothetical protein